MGTLESHNQEYTVQKGEQFSGLYILAAKLGFSLRKCEGP